MFILEFYDFGYENVIMAQWDRIWIHINLQANNHAYINDCMGSFDANITFSYIYGRFTIYLVGFDIVIGFLLFNPVIPRVPAFCVHEEDQYL